MKRVTVNRPENNFDTILNYVFSRGGWLYIRHDGENDGVSLTDWIKRQCTARECEIAPVGDAEEVDQTMCDCLMDGEGCPVALAYCFACQAGHLRNRLKLIEDILGDEYDLGDLQEIADAKGDGRLVVFPEVPEADRQAFVDGLHDYFQEASNYDPSVGIFGMREGEAELAYALMNALNHKDLQPTKPLTEEELRELAGKPVWCEDLQCWGIVKYETAGRWKNKPFLIGAWHSPDYGTATNFEYDIKQRKLTLYRRPPKEERHGTAKLPS